jgi:hypothetical protein
MVAPVMSTCYLPIHADFQHELSRYHIKKHPQGAFYECFIKITLNAAVAK